MESATKMVMAIFLHFQKISALFQRLLKIVFNTDYRFIQRILPGMAIIGPISCLVIPFMDKAMGAHGSHLFGAVPAILSALLWFFPRKVPLSFYHKFHWEAFILWSFAFYPAWMVLYDTNPTSLAINFLVRGLLCGFFAKPIVFCIGYPSVMGSTFLFFILTDKITAATLLSRVLYPFVITLVYGLTSVLVRLVLEYYYHKLLDTELKMVIVQAEKKLNEFKMSTLRAKCDPHFLFNTLNSICQLAHTNPAATEKAILSLSNIFRYILEAGEQTTVRLEDELLIVTAHLELERIRFGDQLTYKININGNIGNIRVPALSIQPLVENSIKHGFTHRNGIGRIIIDIRCQNTTALITVQDNGTGFGDNQPVYGHGLTLLKDRLKHIWGNSASLHLNSSINTGTTVELRIPAGCNHDF